MSTFNTHGGFFAPQDYFRVDTGGSHEENPNGGVQVGVDPQGVPNVLEEGEPVYNDYVYSDNIKAEADILKQFHLPEKFAGKLYSEIADLFVDEAEERPLDPTSNNGLNAMLVRLANAQDEQKRREQEAELEAELAKLSPEELDQLDAMLAEQMQPAPAEQQVDPMQEQAMQEQIMAEQGMAPEQAVVPQEQMMPAGQEMIPMAYGGTLLRPFAGGGSMDEDEPIRTPLVDTSEEEYFATLPPAYAHAFPGKTDSWIEAETHPLKRAVSGSGKKFIKGALNVFDAVKDPLYWIPGVGEAVLATDVLRATPDFTAATAAAINSEATIEEAYKKAYRNYSKRQAQVAAEREAEAAADRVIAEAAEKEAAEAAKKEAAEKAIDKAYNDAYTKTKKSHSKLGKAARFLMDPTYFYRTLPKGMKGWKRWPLTAAQAVLATGVDSRLAKEAIDGVNNVRTENQFGKVTVPTTTAGDPFAVPDAKAAGGKIVRSFKKGTPGRTVFVPTTDASDNTGFWNSYQGTNWLINPPANQQAGTSSTTPAVVRNTAAARPYAPVQYPIPYYARFEDTGALRTPNPEGEGAGTSVGGRVGARYGTQSVLGQGRAVNIQSPATAASVAAYTNPDYVLPSYATTGTPLTRVQQYTSLPQGMPNPFAGYRYGDITAAYRSTSPLYTPPAYTPPTDTLHTGQLVGVTPTTVPTEPYTMDGAPFNVRYKAFLDRASGVKPTKTEPDTPEDGKTDSKAAAAVDNTILPAPLSTAGQYVGPGMAAALALHNFAQSPDQYSIPTYNPVLPNGRLSLVSPRYMPIDVNQTVNDILASNAGALRSIQQSGYGAVMPGAMIAADYTAGRALGTGRVNTRMANNQMRNDVIGQVNNNATAMANFDLGINNAHAGILNPYMRQQAQDALALQQLKYGAEGERYAAIQQQLNAITDYAAKDARQKQYLNQINSNTALPYVVGQDAYARYTGKNGGKLKKK